MVRTRATQADASAEERMALMTHTMEETQESVTQFVLPTVMTIVPRSYNQRDLPQARALLTAAESAAAMEITNARLTLEIDEDRISYLNPFRRHERSAFWSKVLTAIERSAAAQQAAAFASEEPIRDR